MNLLTLLSSAGPLLWVLLLLSLYVVYVAVVRLQVLSRLGDDPDALIERARATTAESGPQAALAELDYTSKATPATNIMRAGLGRADRGNEAVQGAMNAAILREDTRLYAGIQALGTSAQIGPLLGLLGTVIGMVRSFLVFSQTVSPTTEQLATGISEALVNTGAGLIVAIIAYVSRGALRSRADRIATSMERVREELPGWLSRPARSVSNRPATRPVPQLVGVPNAEAHPVDFEFNTDAAR
ncbi:MotA/TolQ/ExbB proton channel family protein [Deinococcus sp. KNUC1210]|uniref:MotA/TolQ/ExbB proton channel family protein n=1 Tax=Deinococcus sp. KNUC1210 TaxID=2917691 RepID=UPI001EEFBC4E|nr:MotA/TolQ/ExbB proton channel family protein [Deinococcus sp. KNUC1210]ULH16931.1 MotA/TolQ/ExbB proton channel family protein [Deinococcus sp. KNUC1210]